MISVFLSQVNQLLRHSYQEIISVGCKSLILTCQESQSFIQPSLRQSLAYFVSSIATKESKFSRSLFRSILFKFEIQSFIAHHVQKSSSDSRGGKETSCLLCS